MKQFYQLPDIKVVRIDTADTLTWSVQSDADFGDDDMIIDFGA